MDKEPLFRCPRRPYLDDPFWYNAIFETHGFREQGFLAEPGTWLDQPAAMNHALRVVARAIEDAREEQEKHAKRRSAIQQKPKSQGAPTGPAPPVSSASMSRRPSR